MLTTFSSPIWLLTHWILPRTDSSGDFNPFLPLASPQPPSPSWYSLFPRLLAKASSQLSLAPFQSTECMLCSRGTWNTADLNMWFPCLKKIQRKLSHCSEDKTQGTASNTLSGLDLLTHSSLIFCPFMITSASLLCGSRRHSMNIRQVEAWRVSWPFLKHSLSNSLFIPCAIHFPLSGMVPPQSLPGKVYLIL